MVTAAAFRQRVAVFQKQIDLPALHRATMNETHQRAQGCRGWVLVEGCADNVIRTPTAAFAVKVSCKGPSPSQPTAAARRVREAPAQAGRSSRRYHGIHRGYLGEPRVRWSDTYIDAHVP
jgi:hypothetical protein